MCLQAPAGRDFDLFSGIMRMSDLFDAMPGPSVDLNGATIWPRWLDGPAQSAMLQDLRGVAIEAPFRQYETPGGRKMSVRMTAAGAVGWQADRTGYAYASRHREGGEWPKIPASVLQVWRAVSDVDRDPDSCLVNFYGEGAKMGLHQDKDEADLRWPVVSISLGDPGCSEWAARIARTRLKAAGWRQGMWLSCQGMRGWLFTGLIVFDLERVVFCQTVGGSTLLCAWRNSAAAREQTGLTEPVVGVVI